MKTFLAALLLMAVIVSFSALNTALVLKKTDELLELAESFPMNDMEFEAKKKELSEKVTDFAALWSKAIPFLAYTSNYQNLNRADEAVTLLFAGFQSNSAADFIAARYDFLDAMRRLRGLEALSFSSIL